MSSVNIQPYISYKGMQKSARILRDFTTFYFPLHGLCDQDFFTYYPLLGFVEALIYQADQDLEAGKVDEKPYTRNKNIILSLLKEIDCYDPLIERELDNGEEYVDLESKMMYSGKFSYEDIIKAVKLRPFDFRVLHCILFRMMNKPFDEKILALIWPVETIADIEDDIYQYPEDVENNHYNTYRMFVKLYGKDAPNRLQKELDYFSDIFRGKLSQYQESEQRRYLDIFSLFRERMPSPSIPPPIIEK